MTVYFSELIFIVTIFNACFFIFRVLKNNEQLIFKIAISMI